jgi:hypothetical protein
MDADMNKVLALTAASSLALAGIAFAAPAAQAKGSVVKMRGACEDPSTSDWTVKIKNKKGQLRTDFKVKTAAPGQTWDFRLVSMVEGQDPVLLAESSKVTVASDDDDSDDDSRSATRIGFRDRDGDDDEYEHDSDDDSVSGSHDDSDDDAEHDSTHESDDSHHDDSDDDSDDDSQDEDSDDDSQGSSSSSGTSRSGNHAAEVKFRTWIKNDGVGELVFTATYNGETCTVTI